MRLLGIVGLVTLGFSAMGCADAKSTTVNDDINWIANCAGGGCTSFTIHNQKQNKYDYKVSCTRSGSVIDISIEDPGFKGTEEMLFSDMHAAGSITLRNVDAAGHCNVSVKDAMKLGDAPVELIGTCPASAVSGDPTSCTVSGTFDKDGWDWIGTVSCPKLVNRNINTQFYRLESAVAPGTPVAIAVDNCD